MKANAIQTAGCLLALALSSGAWAADKDTATASSASPAELKPMALVPEPQLANNCLLETGTHLTGDAARRRCLAEPGEVYTHADLESTGAATTAEALRQLDPRISINGR